MQANGQDTEAAIALVLAGDLARAQKVADDLARREPDSVCLPTFRAVIALGEKAPAKAITVLQAASPDELAEACALTSIRVRARPGLPGGTSRSGRCGGIPKILDHPGIAWNEVIVPLAHLGLGRARALSGDTPGARKAYEDFFALWPRADPDVPVLQQAEAQFARFAVAPCGVGTAFLKRNLG